VRTRTSGSEGGSEQTTARKRGTAARSRPNFATVKLRTRVTKGAGSKKAALAMAYKLLDAASERWRRFNGHELINDVLDGATYKDGIRINEEDKTTATERVAA
jgi:putative transposase